MEQFPLVTIYTCVYNGEKTLERVFKSLRNLDYPNVEHVIINDGSTDGTEELIRQYMENPPCPVKYHKKENGGKHTAVNAAWDRAEGVFLVPLDADDELLPQSIRHMIAQWFAIPEEKREAYWCVSGLCMTQYQKIVGDPYPDGINELPWQDAYKKAKRYPGDRLKMICAEKVLPYRYPEVKGLNHVRESIVWNQMEHQYGTWYTNEVLRIYYVGENESLSSRGTKRKQYGSVCHWYKWRWLHPELYGRSLKNLAIYAMMYFVAGEPFTQYNGYTEELEKDKLLLWLMAPFAWGAALAFRILRKLK